MHHVLCFGEVLWDVVGATRTLGGAPLNVAYHLSRLGVPARVLSAVGRDEAGAAALKQMAVAGIDVSGVRRHARLPTGTARVVLTASEPTFAIVDDVAWDEICSDADGALERLIDEMSSAPGLNVVVHGTLALRHSANRRTLSSLLTRCPSLRSVCDVNLRVPYDDVGPLDEFLSRAWIIKVNEHEAERLAQSPERRPEGQARALQRRWNAPVICVTQGARGAGLLAEGHWLESSAPPVDVVDTIGAGDAWTAGLLAGAPESADSRDPRTWSGPLARACALGALVASRRGAQPEYDLAQLNGIEARR